MKRNIENEGEKNNVKMKARKELAIVFKECFKALVVSAKMFETKKINTYWRLTQIPWKKSCHPYPQNPRSWSCSGECISPRVFQSSLFVQCAKVLLLPGSCPGHCHSNWTSR